MRKQYDFSKGVRRNPNAARLKDQRAEQDDLEDVPPLTKAQIRELKRRLRDSEDRTRYLLASVLTARFVLYYDLSNDDYVMNEPRRATLFKRRAAALAIRELIGGRTNIVRCRVNKRGELILRSLPDRLLKQGRSRRPSAS